MLGAGNTLRSLQCGARVVFEIVRSSSTPSATALVAAHSPNTHHAAAGGRGALVLLYEECSV